MDVSAIATLSSDYSLAKVQDSVSLAVLKKAMDQQGAAILPLIAAATGSAGAPTAVSAGGESVPAAAGQNIDVYA